MRDLLLQNTYVILQHVPSILQPPVVKGAMHSSVELRRPEDDLVFELPRDGRDGFLVPWQRERDRPGGVWKFCSGCISNGTARGRNMKASWGDGGNGETPEIGSWAVVDRFGPFKCKYQRRWPAVDPLLICCWDSDGWWLTPRWLPVLLELLGRRWSRRNEIPGGWWQHVAAFVNEFAENKVKSQTSTKTIVFGISQKNRQPVILVPHTSYYIFIPCAARCHGPVIAVFVFVFGEQANSDLRENAMWRDSSSRPGLGLDHNTGIWVHHSDLASPGKLGSQISWKGNPTSHCCIPFHHIFNIRINPAPVSSRVLTRRFVIVAPTRCEANCRNVGLEGLENQGAVYDLRNLHRFSGLCTTRQHVLRECSGIFSSNMLKHGQRM